MKSQERRIAELIAIMVKDGYVLDLQVRRRRGAKTTLGRARMLRLNRLIRRYLDSEDDRNAS